jgi:hypothetical protein
MAFIQPIMFVRFFNLLLACCVAFPTFSALHEASGALDATTILFALVSVCWLAGAIGLYFGGRLAWYGSLLGVGTLSASSLAMVYTAWRLTPFADDPSDGIGFMMIIGVLGLITSLPVGFGLIYRRRILISRPTHQQLGRT